MKLSVIIPFFNAEKYIDKCLDSIVNQTIGINNLEVILIDDASTDNSLAIVQEYVSKYSSLKIIKNKINKGAGLSKNEGLKHVSCDYVTFVDADDFVSLNAFKYCLDNIESSDLLIFNADFYDKDVNFLEVHKANFKENKIISDIHDFPELIFLTSTGGKVFNKSLFKYLNFSSKTYDDNLVAVNTILNASSIVLLKDATYFYRDNVNSITHDIKIKNVFDLTSSIKELFDLDNDFVNLLAIKFIHDVLFWIYYYEWSIEDEIAMVSKLQDSIKLISKEEIAMYKSLIYEHYPIYEEDILNLLNYDAETFLAKYKYFKPLAKVNTIANLYIDIGNGFNENDMISMEYMPYKVNKLVFNLKDYDNIKSLRFDPIEGEFCKVKLLNDFDIVSVNSFNGLNDEYELFSTLDPYYIINVSNLNEFEVIFELKFLNNDELAQIFNDKDLKINNLNQELINIKEQPKKSIFKFKR